jgi:hypothetical protein
MAAALVFRRHDEQTYLPPEPRSEHRHVAGPREALALVRGALYFEHDPAHGPVIEQFDDEIRVVLRGLRLSQISRADTGFFESGQLDVQHVSHDLSRERGVTEE